ncbi:MAG: M23 family metallopeptidase [Bacteroidetes bacterium]|jgi:murein DD-endopeptidase MepM/ murein hydrolase activator NlpD|nr:M23 family metallopeptidase [Bacteroidota bacterium]MDF1866311.1 M23 family metallopeptidase [Saprospiraceae bacterium]
MSDENKQELTRWEKLQHTYRLVIMNNETFEEMGSYRLSLLNVYIILSTIIVVITGLIIATIVFTPAKRLIPGYGEVQVHAEVMKINQQLDSMEKILANHRNYTESFRKMMLGELDTAEQYQESQGFLEDSFLQVEPIEEDRILRQEFELEQLRSAAQQTKTTNFSPKDLPLEQMYFSSPLSGEISEGFQPDIKHYGVDVVAPQNTAIKTIMDGWVIISDYTVETGNTIGIQHPNNIISFYKHNSALLKKVGSFVKAGEAIAIIGNTGELTDGPHLHFELWHKGKPVDPADFIMF